jgi:hypothetical protein
MDQQPSEQQSFMTSSKINYFLIIGGILLLILLGIGGYLLGVKSQQDKITTFPSTVQSVNQTITPIPITSLTTQSQQVAIEGKIILDYKIPEFPNVEDDISIGISEKGENEDNYYSISNYSQSICERKKDDCVWLISETGNKRIYGYKLREEGSGDTLKIAEKYKVYVAIRHYTKDSGNIAATFGDKVSVEIPNSGIKTQDFILTVYPTQNN